MAYAFIPLLCGLFPSLAHAGAVDRDQVLKPNIVVILADDLGYGDLGCYGHPRFKTPNIDRMAAQGVRLTQFNTPMPFCAPTRAGLLTGRYPLRCGLSTNPALDEGPKADAVALPPGEITLAQILKGAGYATGMVGKWHLGHKSPEQLPTHRGFDEYLGILYSNDMRPVRLIEGETAVEYPLVQVTVTRRYTERALRFIERNRNQPFFLYFAHAMPHKPLACSEAFYKKSGAGLYGDVLAELDGSVGQVLARLKELDLDDHTLVIFASDNGPWYGGSTGGLRGMKSTTWEGGFRVPCIARWPGRLQAGIVCRAPAVTMDIFATALAAAEIVAPHDRVIDGKNLLPLFSGKLSEVHDVVFGQLGPQLATVRDARWKLYVLAPADTRLAKSSERWLDARARGSDDSSTLRAILAERVSRHTHGRPTPCDELIRPGERPGRTAQRRRAEWRGRCPAEVAVRSGSQGVSQRFEPVVATEHVLRRSITAAKSCLTGLCVNRH